ncbi:MAG: hypothetical protein EXR24_02035 [Ignavibacteria bacterium]|nr:hypothetical protein [Ignavibacteria bacterium]
MNLNKLKENFNKYLEEYHSGTTNTRVGKPITTAPSYVKFAKDVNVTPAEVTKIKSLELKFNKFPIIIIGNEIKNMSDLLDLFSKVNYGPEREEQQKVNDEIELKTGISTQDFKNITEVIK